MNFNNSKFFESTILDSTTGNDTTLQITTPAMTGQEKRRQQSQAMFAELHKNQYQKCEEDYVKSQKILRDCYGQENEFSTSNSTNDADTNFGLLFSPTDGLEYPHSSNPDENASTRDEIFVFSVRNIEKIAHSLNVNYDKLKDLFIKIINDEEINDEFLGELNSKMIVDENVTQCDQINLQSSENMSGKTLVFNQSTQTNEDLIQLQASHFTLETSKLNESLVFRQPKTTSLDNEYIQVRASSTQSTNSKSYLDEFKHQNCDFIQPLQSSHVNVKELSISLSQDHPSNISCQLLSYVDAVLNNSKLTKDNFTQNTQCSSPDLFSDSDDDCIPAS